MKRMFLLCFIVLGYSAAAQEVEEEDGKVLVQNAKDWSSEDFYVDEEADQDAFFIDHYVMAGEQVMMISKKYMVDPKDIYKYNADAVNGLAKGTVLKIPLHKSKKGDLSGFIKELEKKKGSTVQVAAPHKRKKMGVM